MTVSNPLGSLSPLDPRVAAAPRLAVSQLLRNMVGAAAMSVPPTITQSASSTAGWTNYLAATALWPRYLGAPTFNYTDTNAGIWGLFGSSKYITGTLTSGSPTITGCVQSHPNGTVGSTNSFSLQGSALVVGTGIPASARVSTFSSGTGVLTLTANATQSGTVTFQVQEKWPGALRCSFEFDGQAFEFQTKTNSTAASVRIWVNEQPHALVATVLNNFAGNGFVKVDFGTASRGVTRRIMVELLGSGATEFPTFQAWRAAPTDQFTRPTMRTSKLAIVGDSFSCATGATDVSQSYADILPRLLGLDGIVFGVSGSGVYSGYPTYPDRAADIIAAAPDAVLINGSLNDANFYAVGISSEITANLTAFIGALRAGLPSATIIVTGPLLAAQVVGNDLAVENLYRAACTATGITFISTATIGDYPVTGTGWSANTGANQVAITGTGSTTNLSPTVTAVTNTRFANGQAITGAGIPASTTVLSGGGTATLTLSANATATAAGVALTGGARTMSDGGADFYRGADSVHPEPRGHEKLARWLAPRVAVLLNLAG